MTKKKTTKDFIKKEKNKVPFSIRVDEQLMNAVDLERQQNGYKWTDLIEAMFLKFLDEEGVSLLK